MSGVMHGKDVQPCSSCTVNTSNLYCPCLPHWNLWSFPRISLHPVNRDTKHHYLFGKKPPTN
jgi:hypothetical protein